MSLGDYNPLDPQYRYCVYCGTDCWPEPENRQHAADCPTTTGIYPVRDQDRLPDGSLGACTACGAPFVVGDFYAHISDETGAVVNNPAEDSTSWVACLPCGVTGADPRGPSSVSQEGDR